MTLKSRLGVTQVHWKWYSLIFSIRVAIGVPQSYPPAPGVRVRAGVPLFAVTFGVEKLG